MKTTLKFALSALAAASVCLFSGQSQAYDLLDLLGGHIQHSSGCCTTATQKSGVLGKSSAAQKGGCSRSCSLFGCRHGAAQKSGLAGKSGAAQKSHASHQKSGLLSGCGRSCGKATQKSGLAGKSGAAQKSGASCQKSGLLGGCRCGKATQKSGLAGKSGAAQKSGAACSRSWGSLLGLGHLHSHSNCGAVQKNGYASQKGGYASQKGGYASQKSGCSTQKSACASQKSGYASQKSGSPATQKSSFLGSHLFSLPRLSLFDRRHCGGCDSCGSAIVKDSAIQGGGLKMGGAIQGADIKVDAPRSPAAITPIAPGPSQTAI